MADDIPARDMIDVSSEPEAPAPATTWKLVTV